MPIQLTWIKEFGAMDFLHDTLWTYPVYDNEHTLDIIKAMFVKETTETVECYEQDNPVPQSRIQDAQNLLDAVTNCKTLQEFADLEYTIFKDVELLGDPNV